MRKRCKRTAHLHKSGPKEAAGKRLSDAMPDPVAARNAARLRESLVQTREEIRKGSANDI